MVEFKENQLLFGIEIHSNEGLLSFVHLPSLDTDSPEIYFCRVNKSWLGSFVAGGLYRIEVDKGKLVQYIKEREFIITQPYYLMLLENKHVLLGEEGSFIPRQYYTFKDWKALISFKHTGLHKLGTKIVATLVYCLSSLLPCLLYLIALLNIIKSNVDGIKTPVLIIGLIPILLWVVFWAMSSSSRLLLKWTYTRYSILRDFTIRTGGMRREIGSNKAKIKPAILYAAISIVIAVAALVFYFV